MPESGDMLKQPLKKSTADLTLLKSHPQWGLANKIYKTLTANGYQTYFAGGCVRDLLLGVLPADIDIATAATPAQVKNLFLKTIDVGENFGVTRIIEQGLDIEVAVFRTDGDYKDGRHPESVIFSDPEHDALRRDFTINALFLDLDKNEVLDYVGGLKDLELKIIRTVGESRERFQEDHLRILRALRFSAQLGFEIEKATLGAVEKMKDLLKKVSGERVRDELLKLLKSSQPLVGFDLLASTGVFEVFFGKLPNESFAIWKKIFPLPKDLKSEIFWLGFFWPLFEEIASGNHLRNWSDIEDQVKLSRDERKAFKAARDFMLARAQWSTKRLGQKILFIHESVGPSLLAFTAVTDSSWQTEFLNLKKSYESLAPQGSLPEAFLKGQDVAELQGPARGLALDAAYLEQLESAFQSRAQALEWLADYLKGQKK